MAFYVYILANWPDGPMYVGSTESLVTRISQHRHHLRPGGFTDKYDIERLVWFEVHDTREGAKLRERRIKKWDRAWKNDLVREMNPGWRDLFLDLSA